MALPGAARQVHTTVLTWEGVTAHPHRFGGEEFRLGRRELGHIHGDQLVDIPFPKAVRDEIVVSGEAQPHHLLPGTGWVSVYIRSENDLQRAIRLLERSYSIALRQRSRRKRSP